MNRGSGHVRMRAREIEPLEAKELEALDAEMRGTCVSPPPHSRDLTWAVLTLERFVRAKGAASEACVWEALSVLNHIIQISK